MPLLPYPLARALLFRLDPERAHELTMQWLARLQGGPLTLPRAYIYAKRSAPGDVSLVRPCEG